MNDYQPIEIPEAEALGQAHGLHQIVIWQFREGVSQHVTTWGEPLRHSLLAAEAGNHVKRAAGWPENYCQDLPASLAKLFHSADVSLANDIRSGTLHKGTVLATLLVFRDLIALSDPQLAEQLIPQVCEAATPGEHA